jgi:acyl-CoA reductase-like NAD-dependent aldehyde dehydrogenase
MPILDEFVGAVRARNVTTHEDLNPATNAPIATVRHDTAATVRNKYRAARAAQGKWAQLQCEQRIDVIRRFRDRIVARREDLARTLTSEVGKRSRKRVNELNGVLGRIDFLH